ncbi:MAG: RHE_PE00001 family protein [Beijerinckiaceae bacterium]
MSVVTNALIRNVDLAGQDTAESAATASALQKTLPWDRLAGPLEAASDALARLDERLKSSPVRDGFLARAHFHEACAASWRAGHLVHLEDLVLHDNGMDVRTPTHELVQAHTVLRARRRLAAAAPAAFSTLAGIDSLRGLDRVGDGYRREEEEGGATRDDDDDDDDDGAAEFAGREPDDAEIYADIDAVLSRSANMLASARDAAVRKRDEIDPHAIVYDPNWDERTLLADWLATVTAAEELPPVLAAALALEAWERLAPLQHQAWLGPLLAAQFLRARRKTQHHLAALHAGLRFATARPAKIRDCTERMIGWIAAIETAATLGLKELERLTLARELLARKCAGRRAHSKLPALADLFLSLPIVSVPLAAKKLRVSQQAATTMIDELKSLTREMTGRSRYRAWGIL